MERNNLLITLMIKSTVLAMIKTKEMYSSGFYIIESLAAANSNYIESIAEAKLLMTYARYYLKKYLTVHDYIITRHGWQMAVIIHDSHQTADNQDDWRLISEQMRLFISTYVRRINFLRGRSGTLVHSNYRRYYFSSWNEAQAHLNAMRQQRIRLYQRKKKYRGIKFHYQIDREVAQGSIFLCSKELGNKTNQEQKSQFIWQFKDLVGSILVKKTYLVHNFQFSRQNPP